MLTELHGKGGSVCQLVKEGQIHCPLLVRPTSEDVVTGNLVQALRVLNPRWWLSDLLNEGLGTTRFRRQHYRRLRIELWENRPSYPSELLPWPEGSTQVDVTVRWENPPTTVYLEMKYGSGLSGRVTADDGTHGYPSDQLVRNLRVGLWECGYFQQDGELFRTAPRDFIVLVVAPSSGHRLVEHYRDPVRLRQAIPHADRLTRLPRPPFVGDLSYAGINRVLARQSRWFTRPERKASDTLTQYLEYKAAIIGRTPTRLVQLQQNG